MLVAGGRVEIRVNELDGLVHALGREDAASQRIEKAFRNFPAIRLRDQRGIGRLGRSPDRTMIKPFGHQFARSICQTVEDERIKPEPLARIIDTAAPVAGKKTVARPPRDLVEMPFVFDKRITPCFRAKRSETTTVRQRAAFTCHKRDESPNDGLL